MPKIKVKSAVRRVGGRKVRVKAHTRRTLQVMPQHGKSDYKSDRRIGAALPGKRVARSGRIYWETRRNRSDARGRRI